MKTDIKTIASFIATAIWADGVYDEAEKIAVSEIGDALEFDENEFCEAVLAAVEEIKDLDEDAANDYLQKAADAVDDEEIGIVLEAALEIVLADGILSEEEVAELLAMATALGISDEMAILMLSDMVKEEPELTISFQ